MGDALYSVCTGSRDSGTHTLIGCCVPVMASPTGARGRQAAPRGDQYQYW